MAVRNFYIDTRIDGRKSKLTGGPQSKTGGLYTHITQRSDGTITTACTIRCVEDNGTLTTTIYDNKGVKVYEYATAR